MQGRIGHAVTNSHRRHTATNEPAINAFVMNVFMRDNSEGGRRKENSWE